MITGLKKILAILLAFGVVLSLVGCRDNGLRTNKPKYVAAIDNTANENVSFENSKYLLAYDTKSASLIVKDKVEGETYTSVPDKVSDEEFDNQKILSSDLVIDYVKQLDINYTSAFSSDESDCIKNCIKIKNGLKITYTFQSVKISVPVEYLLTDSGLSVSVNLNEVTEGGKNMLGRISILPLFSRIDNNDQNGYLFVPSGCGGISYTKDGVLKTTRLEVYGKDYSEVQSLLWTEENVCMPVFAATNKTIATMGIIDRGAEMASIVSSVNDTEMGYSYIYSSFKVRGYTRVVKNTKQAVESFVYNEDLADNTIKVDYCFLKGEKSDYCGMAQRYSEYLNDKYGKKEKADNAPVYSLKVLGGVEEKKFFFGIPYYSLYALTTVGEAKEICDELNNVTGVYPVVQLAGYGKSGLENKYIAGGYTVPSKLGALRDIVSWQKQHTVAIDYDIVNFSKAGNRFSVRGDAARSTTDDLVEQNYNHVALLSPNKSLSGYYLLSRYELNTAADKLLKYANKNAINAISFSTLSNIAYSDYGNRQYFAKSGMPAQVSGILSKFSKNTIFSNSSFEYCAAVSDYIMDAPVQTSKNKIVDEEIPFYQMVFGTRSTIYNASVNLNSDDKTAILKAVESGSGLEFTVNRNYSTKLLSSSQNMLYATYYNGVKNRIITAVEDYKTFYTKVYKSHIVEHRILENGLRKVVYSNGVTVYVNYKDITLNDGEISVDANSFKVKEG